MGSRTPPPPRHTVRSPQSSRVDASAPRGRRRKVSHGWRHLAEDSTDVIRPGVEQNKGGVTKQGSFDIQ